METKQRFVLLIDTENISKIHGPSIYRRIVSKQGKPSKCRLYGAASQVNAWAKVLEKAYIADFEKRQRPRKRTADSMLISDAHRMRSQGFTRFAIASMDGDFAGLANQLRQQKCLVYGFGTHLVSKSLRNSVSHYFYVD